MQALEQMLEFAPKQRAKTIDIYTSGAVELYSGTTGPAMINGGLRTMDTINHSSYNRNIIPYGGILGSKTDMHETFDVDRFGNPYNGHTTIKVPGIDKIRTDW